MNIEKRIAEASFFLKEDSINHNAADQGFVVVGHGCELLENHLNRELKYNASFRTRDHEKRMGRSGNSNHVWDKQTFKKGTGYAIDICHMDLTKEETVKAIAFLSGLPVARVCRYKSFLHVEFFRNTEEVTGFGTKYYKEVKGKWQRVDDILKMW